MLALTEAGRALVPDLARVADANDAAFFAALPEAERAALRRLLAGIADRRLPPRRSDRAFPQEPARSRRKDAPWTRSSGALAETCQTAAETGAMALPEIPPPSPAAGSRDTWSTIGPGRDETYYLETGEAHAVPLPDHGAVAAAFDAATVAAAVRRPSRGAGLYLPGLQPQGHKGGLRRLPRDALGPARGLLRPDGRDPCGDLPDLRA